MKIDFTIGETEQHQMELSFDQVSGDLIVMLDGTAVLQDCGPEAAEPVKSFELAVGEGETHRLAFRLMHGEQPDDLGLPSASKFRLMITAVA